MKLLTNTYKLIYRNEQNTNETSCLEVEGFHTQHVLSLHISYLWYYSATSRNLLQHISVKTLQTIKTIKCIGSFYINFQ